MLKNVLSYYLTRSLQRVGVANQTLDLPLGARCFIPNPPGITKLFINPGGSAEFMRDPSLRCVLDMVKEAKVFWDIGANIGLFSLFAKTVNPSISVVSVEASTTTYGELCRNWSLFPDGWICINTAVGAKEGMAVISRGLGGLNHVLSSEDGRSAGDSELRPMTTLDKLAEIVGHSHIDVLKIDVEGMEWAVLSGAHKLLSEKRISTLVLEADGHGARYGFSESDVTAALSKFGYEFDGEMSKGSSSGNCAVFRSH